MNWFGAMEHCSENGGTFVSIHDMFENMFLAGEAGTIFIDSDSTDFWIGAIFNTMSPGKWSWMDKTPFDFMDWDKGQPQNISDSNCASSLMNGAKWKSNDCFNEKPFVCKVQKILATTLKPIQTTKVPETSICSDGWTYYNYTGFCYKVLYENTTWFNAEMQCVNQSSHLVSIHSYNENLFVAYLTNLLSPVTSCDWSVQAWIGLTTPDNNAQFGWTDGTPYDYYSWNNFSLKVQVNVFKHGLDKVVMVVIGILALLNGLTLPVIIRF